MANFVGIVVGFFNVLLPGVHPQRGIIKTIHFLTGELRYGGVAHIRLRRLLLAAALSFESGMALVVLTYIWLAS